MAGSEDRGARRPGPSSLLARFERLVEWPCGPRPRRLVGGVGLRGLDLPGLRNRLRLGYEWCGWSDWGYEWRGRLDRGYEWCGREWLRWEYGWSRYRWDHRYRLNGCNWLNWQHWRSRGHWLNRLYWLSGCRWGGGDGRSRRYRLNRRCRWGWGCGRGCGYRLNRWHGWSRGYRLNRRDRLGKPH